MLIVRLPLRGTDKHGSGAFEAARGSKVHKGIDLACWPGRALLSSLKGKCTKLGYAYSDDLSFRYVEITDSSNLRHRFFYVDPNPVLILNTYVMVGTRLGDAQDLRPRYAGITPHIHYEILDEDNRPIDPEKFL